MLIGRALVCPISFELLSEAEAVVNTGKKLGDARCGKDEPVEPAGSHTHNGDSSYHGLDGELTE